MVKTTETQTKEYNTQVGIALTGKTTSKESHSESLQSSTYITSLVVHEDAEAKNYVCNNNRSK